MPICDFNVTCSICKQVFTGIAEYVDHMMKMDGDPKHEEAVGEMKIFNPESLPRLQ